MVYLSLAPKAFGDLSSVVSCSDAVSSWFLQNALLLLNPGKTEAVIFGTRQRLSKLIKPVGVRVAGSTVTFADAVKLLGVSLNSTLTFNQHVTNVEFIRPLLTVDAVKTIASAIVGARLDYCNSLLLGTSEYNLDRLQRVKNRLARVVLPFSAGATEARRELHWLPIRQCITFKQLATIIYKARRSKQPAYLSNSLHEYLPIRNLRSASAYYCSNHQPLLCSPLVLFRSRHLVVDISEHSHSLS